MATVHHDTVAGVLIFGFLINILLLKDIDSNTQLVLKGWIQGLIIVIAVFLQQMDVGKRRGWFKRFAARKSRNL